MATARLEGASFIVEVESSMGDWEWRKEGHTGLGEMGLVARILFLASQAFCF